MAAKLDPDNPENSRLQAMLQGTDDLRRQAEEEQRYRDESEEDDDYRYDGKTFDEWRNLWRRELKTERRIEAIAALAAFGRTAYPREAAEAILDVAGEYDFGAIHQGPEGELQELVLDVLTSDSSWDGAATTWLPPLMQRLSEDREKWEGLATALMACMDAADAPARAHLLEMASDAKYGPNAAALGALWRTNREGEALQPRIVELTRTALAGRDTDHALAVLRSLGGARLHEFPEAFQLLFHEDAAVRRTARTILRPTQLPLSSVRDYQSTVEQLLAVLDDGELSATDKANAIRALTLFDGFLELESQVELRDRVAERLKHVLNEGEEELLAPAFIALRRIWQPALTEFGNEAPEDRKQLVLKAAQRRQEEEADLVDEPTADGPPPVRSGFRGGGGGFF
jgi:hypothetical protein